MKIVRLLIFLNILLLIFILGVCKTKETHKEQSIKNLTILNNDR